MIPILFETNETAFTSNGLGRLADATRCEVTEERNGPYELVLDYPVAGKMASALQCGRYIYATHDEGKVPQAFQIYKVSTPIEGVITVNAWHISYALNTIIVAPFTAGSCTAAIAGVKTNSMNTNPFTFWTDKSVTADFETILPMSARAILGGTQGSILDVYGTAEFEFDMYTVKLHQHRGQNRNVSIRYGKNLTKLDQELDASNVYNSCVPYWTDGTNTVVSNTIITRTGETAGRTVTMDLSSEFETQPTLNELKAKAQTKIDASTNYQLKENLKIDFVALWQTEEYKNMASLQRIFLCDTVNVFYSRANVNVTAKCIKTVYDSLRERYSAMELGEPTTSLLQEIQEQVVGDVLENVPSMSKIENAIQHATELIGGGFGGYIKFNYLSDGTPSEMLIMDSPDESTAVNIIRLNQNGLGFSTDGGSTYANAWTIDGNLNASFITTGVLDADLMTAGMIQDASGKNYWNLDTGQFVTKQGEIADFIIDQTGLRSGTVGKGTAGTAITDGTWESTKTGTISSSGYTYQYTVKTKISNSGIEMYAARDDIDADLVQVLKIEPHVWYVNGTARHNVYFSTSVADGYLFSISKATEVGATAYPLNVHKRTEFLEAVKFDKDVQIGTDLTNANLDVHGDIKAPTLTGALGFKRFIGSGDDYNTILEFGKYGQLSNDDAPANGPTGYTNACVLYVISANGTSNMSGAWKYANQIIKNLHGTEVFSRLVYTDGNGNYTFTNWNKIIGTEDLTSSLVAGANVSLGSETRIFRNGSVISGHIRFTTSATLSPYSYIVTGMPVFANAVVFPLFDVYNGLMSTPTIYADRGNGGLRVAAANLPAGTYNVTFTYIY